MSNTALAVSNDVYNLDNYQDKYNVLFPQQQLQQISPFHKIRVEIVQINPNPNAGEVFKVGSKQISKKQWEDVLSLGKTALMKLASAAGIVWNWGETKVLHVTREYVLAQAVGAIRNPAGTWVPLKATKEIDLIVIEEELLESNKKKALRYQKDQENVKLLNGMSPEAWAMEQTRVAIIQWRKNKVMRAETGAMLRVVRALLSLKHQYSPDELQKAFAVPTVDFSPDYEDPEIRKMIATAGMGAISDLFGSSTKPKFDSQPEFSDPVEIGEEDDDPIIIIDQEEPEEDNEVFDNCEEEGTEDIDEILPECADCEKQITVKVHDYSVRKFGRPLCWTCQNRERGAS